MLQFEIKKRTRLKSQANWGNIFQFVSMLFVACAILSGCVFGEHDPDEDSGRVKLLKSMNVEGFQYHDEYVNAHQVLECEYDEQNRLTKTKYVYLMEECLSEITNLTYNNAGELIKLISITYDDCEGEDRNPDAEIRNFTKRGNILEFPNSGTTFYVELNNEGLPIKWEHEYLQGSLYNSKVIWEYQNGNLSKEIRTNLGKTVTTTFMYDDKKSPLLHCKTPKWFFVFTTPIWYGLTSGLENNLTKVLSEDEFGEKVYTYDKDGYPISATIVSEGDGKDTFPFTATITYTYITK